MLTVVTCGFGYGVAVCNCCGLVWVCMWFVLWFGFCVK